MARAVTSTWLAIGICALSSSALAQQAPTWMPEGPPPEPQARSGEVAAVEPPPPAPPPPPIIIQESRYVANLWPRATGGRTLTEDVADGWFGRIEMDVSYAEPSWGPGLIGGTTVGLEGWGSSDGGGAGIPLANYAGFRAPILISLFGVGFDVLVWDYVEHDGGFGIFAPFAMASIGLDTDTLRIMADMRAQYRWQWGAEDRWQIRAGVSVALRVTD